MSSFIKTICFYMLSFIFTTCLYLISFHLPLFTNQKILFYRGISLLLLTIFISTPIIYIFSHKLQLPSEILLLIQITTISLNLCFFVLFPVTFDRSVTIFLLNSLNQSNYTERGLEQKFINDYVINQKAIRRRIEEQSVIGFIVDKENLRLSPKAKTFIILSAIINKIYSVK